MCVSLVGDVGPLIHKPGRGLQCRVVALRGGGIKALKKDILDFLRIANFVSTAFYLRQTASRLSLPCCVGKTQIHPRLPFSTSMTTSAHAPVSMFAHTFLVTNGNGRPTLEVVAPEETTMRKKRPHRVC
jgi:hypothetical protein